MTAYNSTRSTKSTFLESLTTTNFELHKHNYSLTLVLSKIIVNDSKSYIHKRIKLATPQFDYVDNSVVSFIVCVSLEGRNALERDLVRRLIHVWQYHVTDDVILPRLSRGDGLVA